MHAADISPGTRFGRLRCFRFPAFFSAAPINFTIAPIEGFWVWFAVAAWRLAFQQARLSPVEQKPIPLPIALVIGSAHRFAFRLVGVAEEFFSVRCYCSRLGGRSQNGGIRPRSSWLIRRPDCWANAA